MRELTVRRNDAGQRLDRFVGKAVPLLPETLLQKYIRIKRIKLNGKGAKRDTRLNEGDVLSLYINDEFFEKPREENAYLKIGKPRINIVYEDENILLADKKPGVLCHSAGAWDYNTLIANIQAYLAQKGEWNPRGENSFAPALCNRIDRNNWVASYADSEKGNSTLDKMFDLQESTYWQTEKGANFPHLGIVDMGKEVTISAFEYLPRAEQGAPGSVKAFKLYVKK